MKCSTAFAIMTYALHFVPRHVASAQQHSHLHSALLRGPTAPTACATALLIDTCSSCHLCSTTIAFALYLALCLGPRSGELLLKPPFKSIPVAFVIFTSPSCPLCFRLGFVPCRAASASMYASHFSSVLIVYCVACEILYQ